MKNKTFTLLLTWIILWSLITIFHFLIKYGFEILALLYGLTGTGFIYLIIKEELLR
jgi:hypothetical protein